MSIVPIDGGLNFTSDIPDGGVAHLLDTNVLFTSGKLFSLENYNTEKFYVDFAGSVNAYDGVFTGAVSATSST